LLSATGAWLKGAADDEGKLTPDSEPESVGKRTKAKLGRCEFQIRTKAYIVALVEASEMRPGKRRPYKKRIAA
jgi:hypothetical protein